MTREIYMPGEGNMSADVKTVSPFNKDNSPQSLSAQSPDRSAQETIDLLRSKYADIIPGFSSDKLQQTIEAVNRRQEGIPLDPAPQATLSTPILSPSEQFRPAGLLPKGVIEAVETIIGSHEAATRVGGPTISDVISAISKTSGEAQNQNTPAAILTQDEEATRRYLEPTPALQRSEVELSKYPPEVRAAIEEIRQKGVNHHVRIGNMEVRINPNTGNLDIYDPAKPEDAIPLMPGEEYNATNAILIPIDTGVAQETIKIVTDYGMPMDVEVPEDPKEKTAWMRNKVLQVVEATEEKGGGPVASKLINRMYMIITELQSSDYISKHPHDDNARIGQELSEEFLARLHFHDVFLGVQSSTDIAQIKPLVDTLTSNNLNALFNIPQFVVALNYYHEHGGEFTEATKEAFREDTQKEIVTYLARSSDPRFTGLPEAAADPDHPTPDEIKKAAWAQNLAERWWRVTGVRATQAQTEGIFTDDEHNTFKFTDSPKDPGDLMIRRILRFQEWLRDKAQTNSIHPMVKIVDGVDLKQSDYMQYVADKMSDEIDKGTLTGPTWQNAITKSVRPDGTKFNKLNILNVPWQEFNFNEQMGGTFAMSDWSYRRLDEPDKLRKALTDGVDSPVRRPSKEGPTKIKDATKYLSAAQLETNAKIAENTIDFLRHDNARMMHQPNITFTEADLAIHEYLHAGVITPHQLHEVERELGRFRRLRRLGYYFNPFAFIMGIISKILSSGLSGK